MGERKARAGWRAAGDEALAAAVSDKIAAIGEAASGGATAHGGAIAGAWPARSGKSAAVRRSSATQNGFSDEAHDPASKEADSSASEAKPQRPRGARGQFLPAGVRIEGADEAIPAHAESGSSAAGRRKVVKNGRWSARKQAIFLTTLAETANVAGSARAAKVSQSTVRRRRRDHADFRAAWDAALREGVSQLRTTLLDRALNGVEEDVWHGGKRVGRVRKFNDRLALALVTTHGTPAAPPPLEPLATLEEMHAQLAAKLSEMNRRMGGEG